MVYLGIDPGVSGGLALIDQHAKILWAVKMPTFNAEKVVLLQRAMGMGRVFPALERVHSSPQMGVVSAFTFGRGYGQLEMLLIASGLEWTNPTPQAWQKALNCRTRGDKTVSLKAARTLFGPGVNHTTADALLLAEYARRFRSSL